MSWSWAEVEIELKSIWTLQLKYLKSSIEVFEVLFHFTTFPVGWSGGWVAVLSENKAISASKLKLSWVEAELGNIQQGRNDIFWNENFIISDYIGKYSKMLSKKWVYCTIFENIHLTILVEVIKHFDKYMRMWRNFSRFGVFFFGLVDLVGWILFYGFDWLDLVLNNYFGIYAEKKVLYFML